MKVAVRNCLASACTIRKVQVEAIAVNNTCDVLTELGGQGHHPGEGGFRYGRNAGMVAFWDNQRVSRVNRGDIQKSKDQIVFEQHRSSALAANETTKRTIHAVIRQPRLRVRQLPAHWQQPVRERCRTY